MISSLLKLPFFFGARRRGLFHLVCIMQLHRKIRSHAASGGNWVCSSDPCHVASCLGMPLGKRDWSWFTNINLRQESKYTKRHQYTMTMDSRMSRPTPSVRISFLSESPIEVDAPLFKLESPCESCDDRFAYIYIYYLCIQYVSVF